MSILVLTPLFRDALTLQWSNGGLWLLSLENRLWWDHWLSCQRGSLWDLQWRWENLQGGERRLQPHQGHGWVTLGFSYLLEERWGSSNSSSSWIALGSPSKNSSGELLRSLKQTPTHLRCDIPSASYSFTQIPPTASAWNSDWSCVSHSECYWCWWFEIGDKITESFPVGGKLDFSTIFEVSEWCMLHVVDDSCYNQNISAKGKSSALPSEYFYWFPASKNIQYRI